MATKQITSTERKQRRIYNALRNLMDIPKVTVSSEEKDDVIQGIWVKHSQQYVPDFYFQWCPGKEHFRVYIHVAHTKYEKTNAGYCICVLQSGLAATGFAAIYNFIHTHRANNKEGEA